MEKGARSTALPLLLLFLCVVGGCVAEEFRCPLSENNQDFFYASPQSGRPVEGGDEGATCCKNLWVTDDPFTNLVDDKMEGDVLKCRTKLHRMAQELCSPHQESVASSHPLIGVAHVCDSYCNDLLETCGDLAWKEDPSITFNDKYKGDGEYFCRYLFKDPTDSLTASVLPLSSRACIDDRRTPCTDDDITGFYTECDVSSMTKEYHYQFVEGATCAGGVGLPATKVGLPCLQTCEPGFFLPVGETECQECQPGYFSVGGGYLFEQWKDWPSEFEWETHCETNDGVNFDRPGDVIGGDCVGWRVNDTFVESSKVLQDLQSSVLNLRANMVQEGSITFVFRVDAEPMYDGLKFKIDNRTLLTFYSNTAVMETRTFPVSSGMHTFTWVYFKDFSKSKGRDQAFIQSIQLLGTKIADSVCSHCNPGSFSQGGAAKCTPCARDSYSGWYGASECEPCSSETFSYPGAVECTPRQPCVTDDVSSYFTPCTPDGRSKVYEFAEPMICDGSEFTLPANDQGVVCAACNPGLFREIGAVACERCAAGSYSSEVGSTSCEDCEAGTKAVKEIFYTQFDSFDELEGVTTWCSGDCGTAGWRLMSDDIDSGVGHGSVVDSVLQINTELIQDGTASFEYSVVCKDFCKLAVVDVNVTGGYYTRRVFGDLTGEVFEMNLKKGVHQIQVVFSKYLENTAGNRENRMILHEFSIQGVKDAGATSCSVCPAGTYASAKAEFCIPCPPGTYSGEGAESCTPCEDGYYASESGTVKCSQCGEGTGSTEDKTDCDLNGCQFEVVEGEILYDLSAIILMGEMYGPVWGGGEAFFLSPCQKEHGTHSCVDENGEPISTFACKQPALGAIGVDIGSVQGYHALEEHVEGFKDHKRAGLVMTFDDGAKACSASSSRDGEVNTTYLSSILFLCDPNEGKGFPEVIGLPNGVNDPDSCTFQFQWESLYACPVCTAADYYPVYGKCEDGMAVKTYVPNTFPNRCHSGHVPLAEEVECDDSSVVCELGTYLPLTFDEDNQDEQTKKHQQAKQSNDDDEDEDDDTSQEEEEGNPCIAASPGHFSIGGGVIADVFDSWETMPLEFSRDSTWVFLGELIRSGDGTSELIASVDVLESGSVGFDFKLVNYLGKGDSPSENAGFYFYVDNTPTPLNLTSEALFTPTTIHVPLRSGRHTLSWLFVGGVSPRENTDSGVYVVIDKILITGIATSARSETPCREGTYQNMTGQYTCNICPPDTFCGPGEEMYHECSVEEYSLPGSSECETKKKCTIDDFSSYFTECRQDNMRTKRYDTLAPGCDLRGNEVDISDLNSECPGCPQGYYLQETCVGCPLGQYLDGKKCEDVPEGTFGMTQITFFNSDRDVLLVGGEQKVIPEYFRSFCSGKCETDGWRVVNGLAQSGYYSPFSEVESVLLLEDFEFVQEGSISFVYKLSHFSTGISLSPSTNAALPGFLFYMDGQQQQNMIYHPDSDEEQTFSLSGISPGAHNFTWVYHQPLQPTEHRQIFLWDLEIAGSSIGGASDYQSCPEGTYSQGGQETCTPCEAGTTSEEGASSCELCDFDKYTDEEGSTSCRPCGNLVNATEDRTSCDVGCTYFNSVTNHTFDVTPLSQRFSVNDGKGLRYEISLCEKLDPIAAQCQVEEDTFVCISEMTSGKLEQKDGGHLMNIYFEEEEEEEMLLLRYTEGSDCLPRGQKTTEIFFICDPSAVLPAAPVLISKEDCYSKFEWTHRSACPVCTEEDYEIEYGSCVDGEKQVIEVRRTACNGREILSVKTVSCRRFSLPFFLLVAVVVCLLIVLVGFALRNKALSDRYEMLVNSSNIGGEGRPASDEPEENEDVGDLKL